MKSPIRKKFSAVCAACVVGAALLNTQPLLAAEMDHTSHAGHDMPGHSGHTSHDMGEHGGHISHQHGVGQWMVEYRYMSMNMDGLLSGSDSVSTQDISGVRMDVPMTNPPLMHPSYPYRMAPTEMTMNMHMLMAMYGVNSQLTLMAMLHYVQNDMDMVMHMYDNTGATLMGTMTGSMETKGLADTRISALFTIDKNWVGTLGISLPTGSIDEKVDMTMTHATMPDRTTLGMQAPYPMQLGSGTVDFIPAFTYEADMGSFSVGGQLEYTFHVGENDNGYSLGDRLEISAWLKQKIGSNLIVAGRLDYKDWESIEGSDPKIMAMMSPSGDPNNQGGTRVDLKLGFNGVFSGHTVGLEYGLPLLQNLNGPQMETESILSLSYQYSM